MASTPLRNGSRESEMERKLFNRVCVLQCELTVGSFPVRGFEPDFQIIHCYTMSWAYLEVGKGLCLDFDKVFTALKRGISSQLYLALCTVFSILLEAVAPIPDFSATQFLGVLDD